MNVIDRFPTDAPMINAGSISFLVKILSELITISLVSRTCQIEHHQPGKYGERDNCSGNMLQYLNEGNIYIVIGTHRIAGKDDKFKDQGLMTIDEEQKLRE